MNKLEIYMNSLHLNRNPLLKSILKKKEAHLPKNNSGHQHIYWKAEDYKLHLSRAFQDASKEQKEAILKILTRARLEEAYHIEKAGIAFGAKMIIESKTFEERRLYAHFTSEESEHLAMIESYLDSISEDHLSNDFLSFLATVIEQAPKNVLVFIIQVVLEGWGIEHYSELARTCIADDLKASLKKIVQDEAAHHGSGMLLFDEAKMTEEEIRLAQVTFETFLQMIKIGPYSVFTSVRNVLGNSQKLLADIDAEKGTQDRLDTLKALAKRCGALKIVAYCESKNLFTALSEKEMEEFYSSCA